MIVMVFAGCARERVTQQHYVTVGALVGRRKKSAILNLKGAFGREYEVLISREQSNDVADKGHLCRLSPTHLRPVFNKNQRSPKTTAAGTVERDDVVTFLLLSFIVANRAGHRCKPFVYAERRARGCARS